MAKHRTPPPNPDELIPFADVPQRNIIPRRRGGTRLALATLYRWSAKGAHGAKLRIAYAGGCPCTTERWLREFFDAVADKRLGLRPKTSSAAQADTEKELAKQGVI